MLKSLLIRRQRAAYRLGVSVWSDCCLWCTTGLICSHGARIVGLVNVARGQAQDSSRRPPAWLRCLAKWWRESVQFEGSKSARPVTVAQHSAQHGSNAAN